MMYKNLSFLLLVCLFFTACSKSSSGDNNGGTTNPPATSFSFQALRVNGVFNGLSYKDVNYTPVIKLSFSANINTASVNNAVSIRDKSGNAVSFASSTENNDSTVVIQPSTLAPLTQYTLSVATNLQSKAGGNLQSAISVSLLTKLDSSRKFPIISDDALLTLVQQQTFKYFWDFAHPVSGMARERNTSGDIVTTGGTGFGIMAIPVAISRSFITRAQGLAQTQKIVSFLKNNVQKYHGAFPHWLNGSSGATVPFSTKDDGADLVETSYLMAGLLTVRQYFNGSDATETTLRNDINTLWNNVEWSWFRQNNQNVLYWHWSPNYDWQMNLQIRGWNEGLLSYILAASSTTFTIPKTVYDNGWKGSSSYANGNTYYGYQLPLGIAMGGPLFFAHYTFMGVNPTGLTEGGVNFLTQNTNHTLINNAYCIANPQGHYGYSDSVWGLTASDIPNGYTASSPTNDIGVIAPTAALSSFPYTPTQSLKALKFFYYVLGNKIWSSYGFTDAFSLKDQWYATSTLAIDQGPIIVMIENYRTGLVWNLFTSCPEVKAGMIKLGFSAPYL